MTWAIVAIAAYVLIGVGVAVYNVGIGRGIGDTLKWKTEARDVVVAVAFWPYVIIYALGAARGRAARNQT